MNVDVRLDVLGEPLTVQYRRQQQWGLRVRRLVVDVARGWHHHNVGHLAIVLLELRLNELGERSDDLTLEEVIKAHRDVCTRDRWVLLVDERADKHEGVGSPVLGGWIWGWVATSSPCVCVQCGAPGRAVAGVLGSFYIVGYRIHCGLCVGG